MTKICGKSVATVEQMADYLLSVNPTPKINMAVKDFCQLFLDVAAKEGVRGDALFAQSCKETGNFTFKGTVRPEQNNFAGLGTIDSNTPGASFPDAAIGILAQTQHAKAYATNEPLSCPCVDPRYSLLVKYGKAGTAQNWEQLSGRWAVPGYDTRRYGSLKEADSAKDSYGYQIIKILEKIIDFPKEEKGMRINVHAGHNADGLTACGAIGFIQESTEARRVKDAVISRLRQLGHTVYDCTVDDAAGVSGNLRQIVKKCNAHEADLDVSIHFNSGAKDSAGNGRTTGAEVYVYNSASKAKPYAEKVCAAIARLGFRNRGVKYSTGLYVLKNTKAPAMLVECCFVDDKDDVQLYDFQKMAEAIVFGITGQHAVVEEPDSGQETVSPGEETPVGDKKQLYRVQVGAYSVRGNADATLEKLKSAGFDAIIVNA
jgi:N-acetylmuramoyl-L-alanine amidase